MSELPRRRCPICSGDVPVRRNGALREHFVASDKQKRQRLQNTPGICKGSGVVFGTAPVVSSDTGDDAEPAS